MMIAGVEIITSNLMQESVQYSRSPARAARRKLRGFPQHYAVRPFDRVFLIDGKMHIHPAMLERLKRHLEKRGHNVG